jgi:NAD(P)-dependent dehydrogenase (short-subunit alcohol dehydrogenase family)
MSFFTDYILSPPQCRELGRIRASVQGKTVLITGASFGIGEQTALLLAQAGAEVLLLARTTEKLAALVQHITAQGGNATAYTIDLYKISEVPDLAAKIQQEHPRLDIIICNAGKSIRRPITQSFERDDLERCLAVNFTSHAALLNSLLPRMIAQGGGQIVSVSSVGVRLPSAPHWAAYQSSKTGFDVWLRSIATELFHKSIAVSSVYMPLVRTRMIEPTKIYDNMPALSPLQAAQVLAYAIVTKRNRIAPWWLWGAEVLSAVFRTPIDLILSRLEQSGKN